jgi:glycosyltransferase involved in cell wall biosynthesis
VPRPPASWICCQLGAREHYAIPRALHQRGRLHQLVTDAWVRPGSLWHALPVVRTARLRERFHPELDGAAVTAFTGSLLLNEGMWRAQQRRDWDLLIERNTWFQQRASAVLRRAPSTGLPTIVFAHSYTAREPFREAKSRGWMAVLGQIDPGEEHMQIVARAAHDHPEYGDAPEAPPASYFSRWREECELADWIVVNSDWSREALERSGIPAAKLRVVPLPYEPDAMTPAPRRIYPDAFSTERPLRVLFVGTLSVGKGVASLLEAIELVADLPVEVKLVGPLAMQLPSRFAAHPSIQWVGSVPRSEVMGHYRESDVLVFPSLSDGFGMAQVEAQGWGLPIIASRSCGQVVRDGESGILLSDVSAASIAAALRSVVERPDLLAGFARRAAAEARAGVSALASALVALEPA